MKQTSETAGRLRLRTLWLAIGWSMVAAVLILSLMPMPIDLQEGGDKYAHSLAYGGLCFWFGMLHRGAGRQIGVAAGVAAYGAVIEFLQLLTGYRSFEVSDMIANAMGAGIGWLLLRTPLSDALEWVEAVLGANR